MDAMAKKKRRITEQAEEEYEFTPTEFNEREFILKDLYMTKVFLVVIVFGLLAGVVGAILTDHIADYGWIVATLVSFGICASLGKILAALGFRMDMVESKSMAGNYLMFLALALGICILLTNEPFVL